MKIEYLVGPDQQLGRTLSELLDLSPERVVFVSAFVGLQTVMRLETQILDLKEAGTEVRLTIGIDFGGTSHEVLDVLLGWGIPVRIVKHRRPGHTFHPKLFLIQWHDKAEIIIGSSNITEGGFFGNYEASSRMIYEIPDDYASFDAACVVLYRFTNPSGPTAYDLTREFLNELVDRGEVPTEAEARIGRDISRWRHGPVSGRPGADQLFGVEDIAPPPPLPALVLRGLVQDVRHRRRRKPTKIPLSISDDPREVLLPTAFYMTLPTIQGINIPGEARIPLEAIDLATEFWGWQDEYTEDVIASGRIYWNWRPYWKVWSVEAPDEVTVQQVRMYPYPPSSDFRFYARALVDAGGDLGDLVRIRRIAEPEAEYECILARQNTPEYDDWIGFCTQEVRNSTRLYGYA